MINAETEQRIIQRGRPADLDHYRAVHAEDVNIGNGEPVAQLGKRLIERYRNQMVMGFHVPEESADVVCSQLNERIQAAEADPKKDVKEVVERILSVTRSASLAIKDSRKKLEPIPVAQEITVFQG